MFIRMQKDHTHTCTHTNIKRSCSPCQSLVDYGNTKIPQHALKVLKSSECSSWTLHAEEEEGEEAIATACHSTINRKEQKKPLRQPAIQQSIERNNLE